MHKRATRLAFFGATGGCSGNCLASALNSGYTCTALARTPAKLETAMKELGVDEAAIKTYLKIIPGDVRELEAVKQTVAGADTIISGIGGYPRMQWSLRTPVVAKDPTLCQDAGANILQACREVFPTGKKPLLVVVSTTGISPPGRPRDVPVLFVPLYKWLLASAHEDKEVMEHDMRQSMALPETERGIGGYVLVKASLLMDGQGKLEAVRVGTEEKPAVGYTIDRSAVGKWMFQNLILEEPRSEWRNTSVTLTA